MSTTTKNGTQASLSAWQNRHHTVTCPSGQRLRIRIPGVETILEHGELPEELIEIALLEVTREDGAAGAIAEQLPSLGKDEKLARLAEFTAFQRELARAAVVEIQDANGIWAAATLSADDLRDLPDADVEMIAMIVLRLRGTDARGVTVGVEPLDRWRRFHESHGLDPEGCEACKAFLDELSTADVGAV
jgi:hypothetical protein